MGFSGECGGEMKGSGVYSISFTSLAFYPSSGH
jgi:hypothetical protein